MNSLYGRFGMSPYLEDHVITNDSDHSKYFNKIITNIINFGNGRELLSV